MTFTVPIRKEVTIIDKNGEEKTKNIFYILQFIDRERFMASSSSNFVNNISDWIHNIKYKYENHGKKCETCGNKHKYCGCFLEYTKMIKQNTNNCVARKIINISSMKNKRNDFLLHTHFLTRIIISLFYCCKKVFYL